MTAHLRGEFNGTRGGWELSLLTMHDTRDQRPLVFLAVLVSHAVIVLLLVRAVRQPISPHNDPYEPLVLVFFHDGARAITNAVMTHRPDLSRPEAPPAPDLKIEPVPDDAVEAPPEAPPPPAIDWKHEAELAARNGVAEAEKQSKYRDLSALSAEQLSWAKKNHMEPAAPGIPWAHPRVEVQKGGLPVIWINDHCVAVPMMMMMVFCKIGHIEAEGGLFKHMGDPHDP
jgi:hypothetical protein